MPFWNEQAAKFKFDELFASGALLLGRVTYQGFAAAWPSVMTGICISQASRNQGCLTSI
jgi:dihydrofolate reductase